MSRWWVSWYDPALGSWELHSPWWISGKDGHGRAMICAAIEAPTEVDAKAIVVAAYDHTEDAERIEWRFANARPSDWSPFGDRFPRAPWMKWPAEPAKEAGDG